LRELPQPRAGIGLLFFPLRPPQDGFGFFFLVDRGIQQVLKPLNVYIDRGEILTHRQSPPATAWYAQVIGAADRPRREF
jgi:hypothetical protein